MAQSEQSFQDELHSLAGYLSQKKDDILEDWTSILEEEEEQISKLISLSRTKFYDHIPQFLELLCYTYRQGQISPKKIAEEHGAERWKYGFDLRETTKEWSTLHQVLMTHITMAKDSISLSPAVQEEAQKRTAKLIHTGIINSVNEYYQLKSRKAEVQFHDLLIAFQEQEKEKADHNQSLQQTTHNLKGILFSLQTGFSLLEEKAFDDKTKHVLDEMSLAADGLDQLFKGLLKLFSLEAEKEEVDINSFKVAEVLDKVCNNLKPLAQSKGLDLQCNGDNLLWIEGDQSKLQRIAQNLLINSIKYTDKGKIEMSWEQNSEDDWLLTIRDTGPGLDIQDHSYTLISKSDSEGDGIGFLIVRQLCKLLDAVIEIDSVPGEGTTFRIVLPLKYS